MKKKVAILLSGCGYLDGAEITESVCTLIHLSKHKDLSYKGFSLDESANLTNHIDLSSSSGKGNLKELVTRILREPAEDIKTLMAKDYDGLVLPGGFGVAKHFCNWAEKGSQCDVHPEVRRVLLEFHTQHLPIAAFCIAPALLARVFRNKNITLTTGNDQSTASEIEKTGAMHKPCPVTDYCTDRDHKIITTPAYMEVATPFEVFQGIGSALKEFVEMC